LSVTGQQTGVSYSYHWEDCDTSGANCRPIAGATGASYTLQGSDVGHTVRALVSADGQGEDPMVGSDALIAPAPPAGVTKSVVGSSSSPRRIAQATLAGASVSAPGMGSFTLSADPGNPVGSRLTGSTGGFFSVELTPGSSFAGVQITDSHLNGGRRLMVWDGKAWVELPGQVFSPGPPPSVTVTIPAGSPLLKLSQLQIAPALPTNHVVPRPKPEPERGGGFTIPVKVPGRGRVDVLITAWNSNLAHTVKLLNPAPGRFVFARAHGIATHQGTLTIVIHPNHRGQQLVAHHRYRITLRLWVTYTPKGGRPHKLGYYGLHLPS
jgi:hypothetical protein